MQSVKYLCLFLIMANYSLVAQTAEDKGKAIATAAFEAEQGFESSTSEVVMLLRNKSGQESTRQFSIRKIERANDGEQSLIVFKTPKDMKGTATLTYTNNDGSDDQWVYLPAVGRVKRIAAENKSGPFMGSELAYEDLVSVIIDKYTYKYLKSADGMDVVQRTPVDKKSGYTRQVAWFNSSKNHRIEKVAYYDRKNTLLKTTIISNFKLYLDKYWLPHSLIITNHQTGKSTALNVSDIKLKAGLSANQFTQAALKRTKS